VAAKGAGGGEGRDRQGAASAAAAFRFYGDLNDFLPRHRRQRSFRSSVQEHSSVKDTLEAIGVPHPEIGLVLINGTSVGFEQRVPADSRVSVFPHFSRIDVTALSKLPPPAPDAVRFVLDVHLGKLATYLRLVGLDTWYSNTARDAELARLAGEERRILLSRDRGLLKRSVVTYGAIVRSEDPRRQLLEVLRRYRLFDALQPFSRCPRCNGPIEPVSKREVEHELPAGTRLSYTRFCRCRSCGRIYWRGAHEAGIRSLLEMIGIRASATGMGAAPSTRQAESRRSPSAR
jgi:hypothetical protein